MHDGVEKQLPSLTHSETASEGRGDDSDDEKDNFKIKFRLLLAERDNHDLELKITGVEIANRALRARVQELEAHNISNASTVSTQQQLRHELDACKSELETTRVEAREAGRLRQQKQALDTKSKELEGEIAKLTERLGDVRSRSEDVHQSQVLVNDLQETITEQRKQINELSDKNYQVSMMHYNYMESVKKDLQESNRLKVEVGSTEKELEDLRKKLTIAETDRD